MKKDVTKSRPKKKSGEEKKGINTFAIVITAFVLVIVAIIAIDKFNTPDATIPAQPLTEEGGASGAAPDFTLASVGGGSKTLSEYKGKVVMLNFWATWCGPCKREIPDFIEMQEAYREKGFEIVGVSLDDPNAREAVAAFVKNEGINYDVVYGDGNVAQAYGGVRSIPTTFLIDRDGMVVSSQVGLRPKESWQKEIESLL
jgi:cytochrome c biogenesis protein CcmG/thiol:disulfide interchange protein DsbE